LLNTRDEKIIDGLNNQRVVDLLTAKDQSGKHYVNLLDIVTLKNSSALYNLPKHSIEIPIRTEIPKKIPKLKNKLTAPINVH
jgi:hypothetical protein